MQPRGCLLAVCKEWLHSATGLLISFLNIAASCCEQEKHFVAGGARLKAASGLDKGYENDAGF